MTPSMFRGRYQALRQAFKYEASSSLSRLFDDVAQYFTPLTHLPLILLQTSAAEDVPCTSLPMAGHLYRARNL